MTPGNLLAALMSSGGAPVDGTLLKAFTLSVAYVPGELGIDQYGYSQGLYGGLSPVPLAISGKTIYSLESYISYYVPSANELRLSFVSSVDVAFTYMLLNGVKYYKSASSGRMLNGRFTYSWIPDSRLQGKQGQSIPVAFYL